MFSSSWYDVRSNVKSVQVGEGKRVTFLSRREIRRDQFQSSVDRSRYFEDQSELIHCAYRAIKLTSF